MRLLPACLLAACLAAADPVVPPSPPPEVQRIQAILLRGVLDADSAVIQPVCDAAMCQALSAAQLGAVRESVLQRIDREAVFTYLGFYMRHDMQVHLFKAAERSSGNELLMSVTMGGGVCTGLLFQ